MSLGAGPAEQGFREGWEEGSTPAWVSVLFLLHSLLFSRFQRHLVMDLTSFRFELVIVWRIQIDEEGKVLPKLDLLTNVPQQGREGLHVWVFW